MNERQRRAQLEREMAALYREIFELRSATGNPCSTCSRRERWERFTQGGGIAWERLEVRGNRGAAR